MSSGAHARPARATSRARAARRGPWRVGHSAGGPAQRRLVRGQRRSTAAAPTCAPAATPTWPPWCAPRAGEYDALRDRVATLTDDVADAHRPGRRRRGRRAARRGRARSRDPAGLVEQPVRASRWSLTDAPDEVARVQPAGPQPPGRAPAGHPGGRQRPVEGRRDRRHRSRASGSSARPASSAIGNAVQLQGVPYSQPYPISGVGDPAALAAAIDADDYLQALPRATPPSPTSPWAGTSRARGPITAPAYDGLLDITYAKPLTTAEPASAAEPSLGVGRRRGSGVVGRSGSASRSAVGRGRRLGRLLVRRDHDRHRRCPRAAVWPPADSARSRCPSARWCRTTYHDLEPGLLSACSASSCVHADDVGHLLGTVGDVDRDRGPSGTGSPAGGVGLDDLALGLVGLLLLETDVQVGALERRPGGLLVWPTTEGTVAIGLPVETVIVDRLCPVSTYGVAVGVLLMTLSRGTVVSATYSVLADASSPASPIAERACSSVIPIRSGTRDLLGAGSSNIFGSRSAAPPISEHQQQAQERPAARCGCRRVVVLGPSAAAGRQSGGRLGPRWVGVGRRAAGRWRRTGWPAR